VKRSALSRKTALRSQSRLRPVSRKMRRTRVVDRELYDLIAARDGDACQLFSLSDTACRGPLDPCHVLPKGKYPDLRDFPHNLLLGCRRHHDYAHRNLRIFKSWFVMFYPERWTLIMAKLLEAKSA